MLEQIIKHFGGKLALANALGVSPPAVSLWCQLGRIPPRRAIQIEEITAGKFKATDIAGATDAINET